METIPGSRFIPAEIDRLAQVNPNKVVSAYPTSNALAEGCFRDVNILDFSRAINRACAALEALVGYSNDFSTVAYFGPPDMRYHIFIVAVAKLGHKGLISAPRNSLAMHMHLFEQTNCSDIIYAKELDMRETLREVGGLRFGVFPDLEELLWGVDEPKHYPFNKTFEDAINEPFLVLHTSGSTGMPKPIIYTYGWACGQDWMGHCTSSTGKGTTCRALGVQCRRYCMFPPWHAGGSMILGLIQIAFFDPVVVWGPNNRPPNAKDVIDILEFAQCDEAGLAAPFYEDVANYEGGMDALKRLNVYWFGGGAMDTKLGNFLASIGTPRNVFASTEGCIPGLQLLSEADAWNYLHFSPELPGTEFREQSPGLYELVFVRTTLENDRRHAALQVAADKHEWPCGDLFSKHPTRPDHWFYEARTDDLITFKDISKYNPLSFEEQLRGNPLVRHAIMIGNGREQTALLVELQSTGVDMAREVAIENVWESVQAANVIVPRHAVVSKTHILLGKPEKPFLTTFKGSMKKLSTTRLYEAEIDDLYATYGDKKKQGP